MKVYSERKRNAMQKQKVQKNCVTKRRISDKQSKSPVKKVKAITNKTNKNNIRQKKKNYSLADLKAAVEAVSKGISLRKAGNMYGVPPATLLRKKKNPDNMDCKSGPPTVLSKDEEQEILNWIIYRAERGYPITKNELLDSVQHYMVYLNKENPFKNNRPGRHWFERFSKQHSNLSTRTAQHLSYDRSSVTQEDLMKWFSDVETYLKSKNLIYIHPSRVYNCDETNVQLCPKPERVLAPKGARSVYKVVDANEKENMTALFMYSADGTRAPPMIMYKYKDNIPKKVLLNLPSDEWGVGTSDNGWMTIESFYEYFTNVFYKWLIKKNIQFPIIVYLDNHSSHVSIPLVSFCRDKNIEIISLYPNSTHILQPLDISFFHPFKDVWKNIVPKWKFENNVSRVKKEHFPAVLKMALDSFMNEKKAIVSGFRASGLMPFNPNAVDYNVLKKKKKSCTKENQKSEEIQHVREKPQTSNNLSEDRRYHLEMLEENLSPQLLEEFKTCEINGIWSGSIDQTGLFEYWLKIKNLFSGIHI